MITKEQYEDYKRLVQEYEEAEYEENQRDADDELNDDWDDEDEGDIEDTIAANCRCGAWIFGKSGVLHVADCICGAE